MQNTINTTARRTILQQITDALGRVRTARKHSPAPRYSIHVPGFGLVGYYADMARVLDALRYLPVSAYVCDADGIRLEA